MAEYMDSESFMIEDDHTYIDVWMQLTRTNTVVA
jgi:hypothetical protein